MATRTFTHTFTGVLLLVLAACMPAKPAVTAACPGPTVEAHAAQVRAAIPGADYYRFTDRERRAFLDAYNAIEPRSDIEPHAVGIFSSPSRPRFLLLVFSTRAGCVEAAVPVAAKVVYEMMGRTQA